MDTTARGKLLALIVKRISRLAACTNLDRETDRRRTLPMIDPRHLWRVLPDLYRSAAELGLSNGSLAAEEAEFLQLLAADIDGTADGPVLIRTGKGGAL